MASSSALGRIAAVAALIAAVAVVLYLLVGGGGSAYRVTANFENAGQLVSGNEVRIAGAPAGSIEKISLGDANEAQIEMEISDEYAPLRRGTVARVRPFSQSGVANRYVQLELPSEDKAGEEIPDGGALTQTESVGAVDLDQLLNTLDEKTRKSLQRFLAGSANMWRGQGAEANAGFKYLNPFLSTFQRVTGELNRDTRTFSGLIRNSSKLVTALAERRDDVSALIGNLNLMMGAIGRERDSLAKAIGDLPDFMRQTNTTFVNLRGALTDLDPLVDASKPVAKRLQPFLAELKPFARDARPTVRALNDVVRKPGADNDLVDLNRLQPALTDIAAGPVTRNGKSREGALPVSAKALEGSIAPVAHFRPYTTELLGWFDGFSHIGFVDANGGVARISILLNAFNILDFGTGQLGGLIPPAARGQAFKDAVTTGYNKRCPGAHERDTGDGSTPFTDGGKLDCDPSQLPPGP